MTEYRSIIFENDSAHQKYYGWSVVDDRPGLKVLKRRYAVFDRYLMLSTDTGNKKLADVVAMISRPPFFGEIIIHAFDMLEPNPAVIAGRLFSPLSRQQRVFNINTIVIDLTQSEDVLLKQMSRYYPRDIRRAQGRGVVITAHESPSKELQDAFVSAYLQFATSKSIGPLDANILEKMYLQRDAVLFTASSDETITHYLHVYRAGPTVQATWGVNLTKDTGSGTLLHWEAMRYFKARGLSWFDLGGVATLDPSDGIYSFKRRFGGTEIRLGTELGYTTFAFSSALKLMAKLRQATNSRP
jgi:FemAB family